MVSGFRSAGAVVSAVRVGLSPLEPISMRLAGVRNRYARTQYLPDREPALLRAYARRADRAVQRLQPDFVVAPGTLAVSFLDVQSPVGVWIDATMLGLLDYYTAFSNWSSRAVGNAFMAEESAMAGASVIATASEWAAGTAGRQVAGAASKCTVVPFGANVQRAAPDGCRDGPRDFQLLLVGRDWHRKGADVAVAATKELRSRGIPAELDIVGCEPPRKTVVEPYVRIHPWIDRRLPTSRAWFASLYRHADVLVVPSRAECFGLALCEAASFGLPAVAARTGGIPTALHDREAGFLIEASAGPLAYADAIEAVLTDRALYAKFAAAARARFEAELNWPSACTAVAGLFSGLI
jgi:glycosyltransferase involved in cell wall biosynthesis